MQYEIGVNIDINLHKKSGTLEKSFVSEWQ